MYNSEYKISDRILYWQEFQYLQDAWVDKCKME
jgi:hypothetical protein